MILIIKVVVIIIALVSTVIVIVVIMIIVCPREEHGARKPVSGTVLDDRLSSLWF